MLVCFYVCLSLYFSVSIVVIACVCVYVCVCVCVSVVVLLWFDEGVAREESQIVACAFRCVCCFRLR